MILGECPRPWRHHLTAPALGAVFLGDPAPASVVPGAPAPGAVFLGAPAPSAVFLGAPALGTLAPSAPASVEEEDLMDLLACFGGMKIGDPCQFFSNRFRRPCRGVVCEKDTPFCPRHTHPDCVNDDSGIDDCTDDEQECGQACVDPDRGVDLALADVGIVPLGRPLPGVRCPYIYDEKDTAYGRFGIQFPAGARCPRNAYTFIGLCNIHMQPPFAQACIISL